MIIYLHGFKSAPQSVKAQQLYEAMQKLGLGHLFRCPALPPSPDAAIRLAEKIIAESDVSVTLVGSSLGGYYASWLAERYNLKAVLVNPAVKAPQDLESYVGPQTNLYTGEVFEFRREYIDELRALVLPQILKPENFLVLLETGDEVLNYHDALEKYLGARQIVIEGGDHSFQHWPEYLGGVLKFAGMA